MAEHKRENLVAHGVEALIERIREEGTAAGREQAEALVAEAQTKARELLDEARQEAERLRREARAAAEREQRAGQEALRAAARDAVIALRAALVHRFSGEVGRLVSQRLDDPDLLDRMILEIVGRVRPTVDGANRVELVLPQKIVGLEELRRSPEELAKGAVTGFVRAITAEMLRDGVTFGETSARDSGLRVRLADEGIELDLREEAISALLLEHLQPRFRALLQGFVK